MAIQNLLLSYHEPLCSVETNWHTFGAFMFYDEFDKIGIICAHLHLISFITQIDYYV